MKELEPCPFCGARAIIKCDEENFRIIGCDTHPHRTMLCPSPSMVVYPNKDGEYDYRNWNKRVQNGEVL